MWWLVLAFLLITTPAQATVLWFAGVEPGDRSEFPTIGGTNGNTAASTTQVKTGAYSLSAQAGASGGYVVSPATFSETTAFIRVQYYPNVIGPGNGNTVVGTGISAGLIQLCINLTTAKLFFSTSSCTVLTQIATATNAITTGAWHLLEIKVVISATVGGMELKMDGVTEFTSFGTNTSTAVAFTSVAFGHANGTGSGINSFFDDMMFCNTAYCPAGGTIARQGTTGSPTYTAWTKNSCTGGTIDGCWSETPFTATTPSASSTVLNDAQTMIVHDFGTTQTGHGTQTVGNTSTVNACKTAMVANAGSTGTLTMRRRISADTDTAKSITTTNAYYDDGIWTTTADILRNQTIEIGATQGENTETQTVRDMWLMCDYANSTATPRHKVIQQ